MAVRDASYKYYPSQERLVNVSNYMIDPKQASPSPRMASGGVFRTSEDFDMRSVRWSERIFSVKELLSFRFPVIVKVVSGYRGDDGQQLTVDQILQVYSSCEQMRVSAVDNDGRTLTLPADYPFSVRLLTGSSERSDRPFLLSQILGKVRLPAFVEFLESKNLNEDDSPSISHISPQLSESRMTLQEISSQRFLLANAITNGWLDQSKFIVIPEQLELTFRLAVGTRHTTPDEWKDVSGMYNRAARHFKFHLIKGYDGVIYDDWVDQVSERARRGPPILPPDPKDRYDGRRDEDDDDDSDSDSMLKKSQHRLLWQQTPLNQGSLPSLPTASSPSGTRDESTKSGDNTPSQLSMESLHPCKSTESLLPRGSTESEAVDKTLDSTGKRKSNVPSRFRRRKGDGKKPGVDITEQSSQVIGQRADEDASGESLERVDHLSPSQPNEEHILIISTTPRSTELRKDLNANRQKLFQPSPPRELPEPRGKVTSHQSPSNQRSPFMASDDSRLGKTALYHSKNTSLDDTVSNCDSSTSDSRYSESRLNDTPSNSVPKDIRPSSSDVHMWAPVSWSSDLCLGPGASSAESEISRMKQRKQTPRSSTVTSYDNPTSKITMENPSLSPTLQNSRRVHSFGFLDSTQSHFSSSSSDLSARNGIFRNADLQLLRYSHTSADESSHTSTDEPLRRKMADVNNDAIAIHDSQPFCDLQNFTESSRKRDSILGSSMLTKDYGIPSRMSAGRSRKQTNGSVKMKLDMNGTGMSSGSDGIDDGYGTKGNSMTSSLDTLSHGRQYINTEQKTAFYI